MIPDKSKFSRLVFFLLCFVTLTCSGASIYSQSQGGEPANRLKRIDIDPSKLPVAERKGLSLHYMSKELQTAQTLIKNKNFFGAAALLEVIYESNRTDSRVTRMLLDCYLELKRLYSAAELIRRQIAIAPREPHHLLDLADVYFRDGKTDSAILNIDFALGIPADSAQIRTHAHAITRALRLLLDNWQDSLVIEISEGLRETARDSLVFASETAEALHRMRDYAGALRELFKLIRFDTTRAGSSRRAGDRKVAELIAYPEARAEVETELKRLIEKNPFDTVAIKYLGGLLLKKGDFDSAYDVFVRNDSLTRRDGGILLYYIRECFDRGHYKQSLRMGEYSLNKYPRGYSSANVQILQARAFAATGNFERALNQYREIMVSSPLARDQANSAYQSGVLFMNNLNQYDSARKMFDTIITTFPIEYTKTESIFRLYELDIIEGNLSEGRNRLESLAMNTRMDLDQAEEVEYKLSRLALLESKFDDAELGFKKVVERFPRGLYVNDAIMSILALGDGKEGGEELLDLYRRAELYRERRMYDSVIVMLKTITERDEPLLADLALLELGKIYLSRADTSAALATFEETAGRFPESYFAPFADKLKGDIYFESENKLPEALAIYRSLLKNFSSYPFSAKIRERIRKFEEEQEEKNADRRDA